MSENDDDVLLPEEEAPEEIKLESPNKFTVSRSALYPSSESSSFFPRYGGACCD
jgi:hypothetical protein